MRTAIDARTRTSNALAHAMKVGLELGGGEHRSPPAGFDPVAAGAAAADGTNSRRRTITATAKLVEAAGIEPASASDPS